MHLVDIEEFLVSILFQNRFQPEPASQLGQDPFREPDGGFSTICKIQVGFLGICKVAGSCSKYHNEKSSHNVNF
jgi:hypothetical protein